MNVLLAVITLAFLGCPFYVVAEDKRLSQKNGIAGTEPVDLRVTLQLGPAQVTQEILDYILVAAEFTFDQTNPDGYKSSGTILQSIKLEKVVVPVMWALCGNSKEITKV